MLKAIAAINQQTAVTSAKLDDLIKATSKSR